MAFVPQRLVILAIFVVRAFGSAGEKWGKNAIQIHLGCEYIFFIKHRRWSLGIFPQRLVILAIFVVRAFGPVRRKWEKPPYRYILVAIRQAGHDRVAREGGPPCLLECGAGATRAVTRSPNPHRQLLVRDVVKASAGLPPRKAGIIVYFSPEQRQMCNLSM